MTSTERNKIIKEMMEMDLELALKKGHDYSGDKDCMANLKEWGFKGVVIRMGDKYYRLKSFIKSGELYVKDESILDTLHDLRIYGYLGEILYRSELDETE